ncbi:serine hydrolase domain-containing protein [Paenibacillus mendelii]|uniref:Serine hydrolase domain-containing protein n=1 Tax=Paenibacillus mendelii TaxID=206163 RepID=A0ABV6JE83_9BACL|nr:serine hydrolase domain-containing protein [Paenibacillus mendelii]MCQ6557094.1 beta-lactamase family protein [Paenibacillus mendelii]
MKSLELSNREVSYKLVEYMNALERRGYYNGSVLVARNGQILLSQGYGMASFEHEAVNTSITKFRLGAITKGFTAIAILQLQEQGKLSVDDFICRHLPGYPNGESITIHHLLSNSSGIPDYPRMEGYWVKTMRLFATIEDTFQTFKDQPLEYTPGEQYSYSSSNYIILSAIIEKVSGLSYNEYIFERICRPLNMNNTGIEDGRSVLKDCASGYSVCKEIFRSEFVDMSIHLGAGAMYSTVEDLYVWDRALYTERLISERSLKMLFDQKTPPCGSYGWIVDEHILNKKVRKRIGHVGSMNGFWADFNRYVDDDLVIIVLSNVNLTPVETMSRRLAQIAYGESVEVLQEVHPIKLDPNEMEQYAGIYEYGRDDSIVASSKHTSADMEEALNLLTSMKIPDIAVGRFHAIFQQYGIHTDHTIIVICEKGKLYLFMPKQYHGAWFQYEFIPVSRAADSTTWVALHIDEQVVFNHSSGEEMGFIHRDVNGNQIYVRRIHSI